MYLGSAKTDRTAARLAAKSAKQDFKMGLRQQKQDLKEAKTLLTLKIQSDATAAEGAALTTEAESKGAFTKALPWVIGAAIAVTGIVFLVKRSKRRK